MTSLLALSMVSSLRAFSSLSFHPIPPCLISSLVPKLALARAPHLTRPLLFTTARPPPLSHVNASRTLSASSSVEDEEGEQHEGDDAVDTFPKGDRKFSLLTPKEKKELRAYAHGLGKKIVSQQVGKAGVTASLAEAISDALEAKEILKLKVLDNCPDELEEVIRKIEEATQGQVVGKIGSVILLYRPSLRKLSVAEKKQNKPLQGRWKKMSGSVQVGRRV